MKNPEKVKKIIFHSGATPVMAEHRFLEKVQWLEMYGVDLHPVQVELCFYFLDVVLSVISRIVAFKIYILQIAVDTI